jgi:hypothetical protein
MIPALNNLTWLWTGAYAYFSAVASYSDDELRALISCPKMISETPKREMKLVGADWRKDMKLLSEGVAGQFLVFMRRNDDFPENFSIGLTYQPNDTRGDVTLLRCNGPHGEYSGRLDPKHPHWGFYVHEATAEVMESGFRAEKNAKKTGEYASFEEAIQYFLKRVNLRKTDAGKHFPDPLQGMSFDRDDKS